MQDQYGNAVNATGTGETVALSSTTPANASFSQTLNAAGSTTLTITIPNGSSSANFYYGYNATGTPTITAAHTGLTSDTQQETIGPNQLVITSNPVSGLHSNNNANIGPITVTLENAAGTPITTAAKLTVNLSSTSANGKFAATSGGTSVTSVSIAAGASSTTFYYGDRTAGSPTITVAGTGLTSGTQRETIT